MKKKVIIPVTIAALILVTAVIAVVYFKTREVVPENALQVVENGDSRNINVDGLQLTDFSGVVKNGKGEEKTVDGKGILLDEVILASDFSEITVYADDAYSAVVKADELDRAWLLVEDGNVRLIVLGDENSKRDVKQVVRIEVS